MPATILGPSERGADYRTIKPAKPRAKPSTKSAAKPAAQVQPSLHLESPFLWPLLSMCSSSESNTPARKSGTQSQFLSRAEHASQWTVPGSFVVHMPSCLYVLFCVARLLHGNRGCEATVIWRMFPRGARIPLPAAACYARRGVGVGGVAIMQNPAGKDSNHPQTSKNLQYPPLLLNSKRPSIVSRAGRGGGRESSLSVFQIFLEGWKFRLSCVFSGWTR